MVQIEYEIKEIRESLFADGHVDVYMEPVEQMKFNNGHDERQMVVGPRGDNIPFEMQGMVMDIMAPLKQMMKKEEEEPRGILFIEGRVEFDALGWKFGDRIMVKMEKKA